MSKDKLNYTINKKEYLLMEHLLTGDSAREEQESMEKLGCIIQGIKEVKQGGFFSSGYGILKVLVPINKIQEFQNIGK